MFETCVCSTTGVVYRAAIFFSSQRKSWRRLSLSFSDADFRYVRDLPNAPLMLQVKNSSVRKRACSLFMLTVRNLNKFLRIVQSLVFVNAKRGTKHDGYLCSIGVTAVGVPYLDAIFRYDRIKSMGE